MKVIFECETELGRCDAHLVNGYIGSDIGEWIVFAHTTAASVGSRGMLRIEQHCYLRAALNAHEIQDQPWVKAETAFEPVLGSKNETMQMLQRLHDEYVQKARTSFWEQSVVAG